MSGFHRLAALLASFALVVAGSGCCCLDSQCTSVGVGDCTSYPGSGGCAGDVCGGSCGGGLGAGCGIIADSCVGCCGGGWYSGGGSCGVGCGSGCGGWVPGCGPVVGLLRLVRQALVCGLGCGQVYWGDWISDPPACSDPCSFSYGDGGCGGGCGAGITIGGCTGSSCGSGACGGGGCAAASQRSYNWGHPNSGTCPSGVCNSSGQNHQHLAAKRPTNARTATMPRQFKAGDRVVHVTNRR